MSSSENIAKVVLVTGSAHRIGASIVEHFHSSGFNIVLHYKNSEAAARKLADKFNQVRPDSAISIKADLSLKSELDSLITGTIQHWGRLDHLVNNASTFYPTPIGTATEEQWDDLMSPNLKAPFFLSQAAASELIKNNGSIVNIVDIHADRPVKEHPIYCAAKAGLVMLTKSLARELSPHVRVNAVAPGAILWPENELSEEDKNEILDRIPLKRQGEIQDIANAVFFLATGAHYTTGHILTVDGGRSVFS